MSRGYGLREAEQRHGRFRHELAREPLLLLDGGDVESALAERVRKASNPLRIAVQRRDGAGSEDPFVASARGRHLVSQEVL